MTVTLLVVLGVILLALLLMGVLPVYSSSRNWGYAPGDILAVVVATAAVAALI